MEIKTVTDDSTKRQLKLSSQLSGRRLQIIVPVHKEKAIWRRSADLHNQYNTNSGRPLFSTHKKRKQSRRRDLH